MTFLMEQNKKTRFARFFQFWKIVMKNIDPWLEMANATIWPILTIANMTKEIAAMNTLTIHIVSHVFVMKQDWNIIFLQLKKSSNLYLSATIWSEFTKPLKKKSFISTIWIWQLEFLKQNNLLYSKLSQFLFNWHWNKCMRSICRDFLDAILKTI